jgi:hypothetical protein
MQRWVHQAVRSCCSQVSSLLSVPVQQHVMTAPTLLQLLTQVLPPAASLVAQPALPVALQTSGALRKRQARILVSPSFQVRIRTCCGTLVHIRDGCFLPAVARFFGKC